MITKDIIETAYAFFHQKQRIYQYSKLDWQKDDIEMAIASYVDDMNAELREQLSRGDSEWLHSHTSFAEELISAVEELEKRL